eukprot:455338-Amphidinium_carterae.1
MEVLPQNGLQADVLWEGVVEEPAPDETGAFAPACTRTPGEWNARVYRVTAASGSAAQDYNSAHPQQIDTVFSCVSC